MKKFKTSSERRIIVWNPRAKNASREPYDIGITLGQYRNQIKKVWSNDRT